MRRMARRSLRADGLASSLSRAGGINNEKKKGVQSIGNMNMALWLEVQFMKVERRLQRV